MDDYVGVYGVPGKRLTRTRRSWEALIHPDDKDKVLEAYQHWFEGINEDMETEYRVITRSNECKWVMDLAKIQEWGGTKEPFRVTG
jgi:hypothetical protein